MAVSKPTVADTLVSEKKGRGSVKESTTTLAGFEALSSGWF
jgi:hypothetical protein